MNYGGVEICISKRTRGMGAKKYGEGEKEDGEGER